MDRIYIITYDFYEAQGGVFKLAPNPVKEARTLFFKKEERDKFIAKYKSLKLPEKEMYIDNVKCFHAMPAEIVDMDSLINAI